MALLRSEGFATEADGIEPEVNALLEDAARQRRQQIDRGGRTSRLTRDAAAIRQALERRDPDAALAVLDTLQREGLSLPDGRKLASSCSEFSEQPLEVEVLPDAGTTATVKAHVQTNCRQKAGKAQPPRKVVIVVMLEKAGDTYRITQVNRPDQAR